ncbi:hypothetical protein EDB85DRAFT_1895854 [Lactarius pseudohatsudake]|nr:hypothetical protein EDB85DRAFT_1895854 [Lactarius pseudohatsudake]
MTPSRAIMACHLVASTFIFAGLPRFILVAVLCIPFQVGCPWIAAPYLFLHRRPLTTLGRPPPTIITVAVGPGPGPIHRFIPEPQNRTEPTGVGPTRLPDSQKTGCRGLNRLIQGRLQPAQDRLQPLEICIDWELYYWYYIKPFLVLFATKRCCECVAVIARSSAQVVVVVVIVVVSMSMLRLLMRVVLAAVGVSFLRLSVPECHSSVAAVGVVLAAVGVSFLRGCRVVVVVNVSSSMVVAVVVVVRVGVDAVVVVEAQVVGVGVGAAVGPGVEIVVTGWDRSQPALWRFTQMPDLDEPQPVKFPGRMNRNRRSGCHRLQSGPVPVFFRFMGLDFRTLFGTGTHVAWSISLWPVLLPIVGNRVGWRRGRRGRAGVANLFIESLAVER